MLFEVLNKEKPQNISEGVQANTLKKRGYKLNRNRMKNIFFSFFLSHNFFLLPIKKKTNQVQIIMYVFFSDLVLCKPGVHVRPKRIRQL